MKTQPEYEEFDFKKGITQVVAKVEKQSYKKLSFLMIGCAALLFTGYTGSNVLIESVKRGHQIEQQQQQLLVQNIKQMDEKEFSNMLDYISKNVDMYSAKVEYVQTAIVKADKSETLTMSTSNAEELGKLLTRYKSYIKDDVTDLLQVRNNVINNIEVKKSDINLFFKYMSAYKSKLAINDERIDNTIHKIVFNGASGNMRYNDKNNVSEKIKEFDLYLKNFEFVENKTASKPKI